jgi:hypothetical protein
VSRSPRRDSEGILLCPLARPRLTIYNEISIDGRVEGFETDVGRTRYDVQSIRTDCGGSLNGILLASA